MSSNSESAGLNRKLTELREQRKAKLLEIQALRDRQERVPLATVPGLGSAFRIIKRLYLLPHTQIQQQAIDQIALEESETLTLALNNAINVTAAGVKAALAEHSGRVDNALQRLSVLEQGQSSHATRIEQIAAALAQLQDSSAGMGTHLNLVNVAILGLQQQQVELTARISEINNALADLQRAHADVGEHVNQVNDALTGLQHSYANLAEALGELQHAQGELGTHVVQVNDALTDVQHAQGELGTHVVQVNDALSGVQHAQGELTEIVNRLQYLPDQMAVQDEHVQRLGAQVAYLPSSINEIVADLRRAIEQINPGSQVDNQPAQQR